MHVVVHIEGRDAVPVRAVLLATLGNVTAQSLALELSKPDTERKLTAYRYNQEGAAPVRADAWGMQYELLTGLASAFKREEPEFENPERDRHREAAWRKSLESLPPGVFVWLDEFKNWYDEKTYYSQYSEWEESHRVIGEDDDPEPQYQLRPSVDTLDLFPIAMADCEDLIFQGFEDYLAGNETTKPAGPKHLTQENRIVELLKAQGHNPKSLPKRDGGKRWVKADIRVLALLEPKIFSKNSFDKAWDRLRECGNIADSA